MSTEPEVVTLPAGQTLFREGDAGETAFLIESGCIEVQRHTGQGHPVRLAALGAGALLGEMALIDRLPRTATAVATAQTRLRVITRQYYDDNFRKADPLIRMMLRALLQRHRHSVNPNLSAPPSSDTMEMDGQAIMARLKLEQELRAALAKREFVLHFQPIVQVASGRTAGFEALLRWHSPERGMVPPGAFIPVAEESPLIVDIGRWVLQEGCAALARLRREQARTAPGAPPLFLTVNVSGRQFESGTLYDDVAGALAASPPADARLKLEITESLLMSDIGAATALVVKLKALGAELAVDDFGTGYSSLSYLHQLDADTLKVDRSFVKNIETDPGSVRVLQAIKGLANGFELETVVEGIEFRPQRDRIRDIGFDYIQGFVYSKALPEDQAAGLVSRVWD